MSRPKKPAAPKEEREGFTTLQVPVAIKMVLKKEQTAELEESGKFKSMHKIVAEALADHFESKTEYIKILKEAGLLD
jgi:hypothetical protein